MVDKVKDILPIIQYKALSMQTVFPYPFPVFASGDLVVTVDSVTKAEGTDYTVSGVGLEDGGDITFSSGLATNSKVTIYRDMSFDRLVDYQQNGDFLSSTVNDDFDRVVLMIQQLNEVDARSLKFAPEDVSKGTTIDTSQKSKLLGLDENGSLFYFSASSDVETDYKTYSDLSSVIADASLVLNDRGRIQGVGDFEIVSSNPDLIYPELNAGGLYIKFVGRFKSSIADLSAAPQVVGVYSLIKSFWPDLDAGGGTFVWNPDRAKTDHNGATVVDPDKLSELGAVGSFGTYFTPAVSGTGCFERVNFEEETPEMYGCAGDGVINDTLPLSEFWTGSAERVKARGHYLVNNTTVMTRVTSTSFHADLVGAKFKAGVARSVLFRVQSSVNNIDIGIYGGELDCNNNCAIPVYTESLSSAVFNSVIISGLKITDVFGNTAVYSSSCVGIRQSAESKFTYIGRNTIDGVNRDYVNPGVVSSIGIFCNNITGIAYITENDIRNVQSPVGDADADGVVVFRALAPTSQRGQCFVDKNTFYDCKGRFVKGQLTGAKVTNNKFYSLTGEIITAFRAIDSQFGNMLVRDNYWEIDSAVTGGAEAVFFFTQQQGTGNLEKGSRCINNNINLKKDIRYLCQINVATGAVGESISVKDNKAYSDNGSTISDQICRVSVGAADLSTVVRYEIEIEDNQYPSDTDTVLLFGSTLFNTDATTADKFGVSVTDNLNTVTPTTVFNFILDGLTGSRNVHLADIKIAGNTTGGIQKISTQSTDFTRIRDGSHFYYETDGSTGGLLNTPTSWNRFVHVYKDGRVDELRNNPTSEFISRTRGSASWYKYTGTLLP